MPNGTLVSTTSLCSFLLIRTESKIYIEQSKGKTTENSNFTNQSELFLVASTCAGSKIPKRKKHQQADLKRRRKSKMKLMKPILANATLQHLAEGFPFRIWIDTVTCTIQSLVILIVNILSIFNLFVRLQLADALAKLGVSTITAEMSSGPKLHYLQRKVQFR